MDCHFLLQGIFPTQGLNPPELAGRFFTTETPGKHNGGEAGEWRVATFLLASSPEGTWSLNKVPLTLSLCLFFLTFPYPSTHSYPFNNLLVAPKMLLVKGTDGGRGTIIEHLLYVRSFATCFHMFAF